MSRITTLSLISLLASSASAQQIALDWATPTVPANNRVKVASTGGVFALGTGDNSAVLQRISAAGTIQWTKTLSAPTLRAIDMDVDGSDNVFIHVYLETGQLDLDPGPNTTLVDPGKVYAKYNSTGAFQWGGVLENGSDASEDYGGVSCDDEGNLYICGDLGEGVYDFDFGAGVNELTVGDFSTGTFLARYRPNGELAFADVRAWYGGFSNARDIAAMRDGSSFYVVQTLDNNGAFGSPIDVDPGPGVFNVATETQSLLRYDSAFAFLAQGSTNFNDVRLCVDAIGDVYALTNPNGSGGAAAQKYSPDGQTLTQVYNTALTSAGNLRLGDVAFDEQGGCLGMYSNNGPGGVIRFYKMNVSGLVDLNLSIPCGNDYTYPGGKGFDLDGSGFYMGTFNNGYTVDFDPGPGTLALPSVNTDEGVVARFDWCSGAPFDPFGISTPGALCVGAPTTFSVSAFGDASGYDWTVPAWWTITDGQGTGTITVEMTSAGAGTVSVMAVTGCGNSAPISLSFEVSDPPIADIGPDFTACVGDEVILFASPPGATYLWQDGSTNFSFTTNAAGVYSVEVTVNGCSDTDDVTVVLLPVPSVELGPDQVICPGNSLLLNAEFPGATYLWSPGAETTASITVSPDSTTVYSVTVFWNGCLTLDGVIVVVDPCLGLNDPATERINVWPVPVTAGEVLQVRGPLARDVLGLIGADGRAWPLQVTNRSGVLQVGTSGIPPGVYSLRTTTGGAVRIVVR